MAITLHHLEYSRSTRVIWLLEELGLAYDMVRHQRNPTTHRAPPELAQAHPLAKAPTIIVDGHVMVESGAIIEFLIERYGDGKLAPAQDTDRAQYLEWLHFAEGTMAMPIILNALGPRFGGLGEILGGFIGGEVTKLLDHADAAVDGREFLVGETVTGADVNLAYLLEVANVSKLLDSRPNLAAYLKRLQARPAYQKALDLGGPMVFGQ